jgi:hypothetical protein
MENYRDNSPEAGSGQMATQLNNLVIGERPIVSENANTVEVVQNLSATFSTVSNGLGNPVLGGSPAIATAFASVSARSSPASGT